jgi:two-component system, LytTR family, sensor kinase
MTSDSSTRQRWLWVGFFAALWTCLACLSAAESYVGQLKYDKPITWELALRRSMKDWYTYGVLSIGVIWFSGRNRLEHGRTWAWVLKHLVAALVFSAAYILTTSWLLAGERSVQTGQILTFSYLVKKMAIHYCIMTLIMYWLMVFAHSGWHYYRRYREREVQTSELRRELTEARLEALRMQLNPHFLFNTLHAISALIHESPEAADRVVARLSELLRLSLDQSKPQEVPLSEEIGFLEQYLEIEQTRFADRLKVEKQIEPETTDALVPYLILQPLVENAIRHGIEPREEQGKLGIRARRNNGTLELRVTDNGAGLSQQETASLREGIGISNTRSRLQHLYGANCRFELVNVVGGGLEACLDIPFHTVKPRNATQ